MTPLAAPCYEFRGHPVRRLSFDGALAFIAREVGTALGYEEGGKRFVRDLTTAWAPEIREGAHWHRVKGERLRQLKADLALGAPGAPSQDALARVPEIVLLTEEGLNLAVMKSQRPLAQEFRSWLAREVVPEIVRTGKYDPAPTLTLLPRLPRLSPSMAALRRLVDGAIGLGRLDVAVELLNAARKLSLAPGTPLLPPPARLRASNRLLTTLVHRGVLKGTRRPEAFGWLLEQEAWKPSEKVLLGLLLDVADDDLRVEGQSLRDIGEALDLHKRTVLQGFGVFERAGVVGVFRSDSHSGARAPNVYRLDLGALAGWNGKPRPVEWDQPKTERSAP